jgi:hypothetical protein
MLLRTCVRLAGTLTVRLLGEQKMTDDNKIPVFEIVKIGGIPDNMIYWSKAQDPLLWANVAATTNSWEIEVDFHD